MSEFLTTYWPWVTSILVFLGDGLATGHVVLYKRDHRAALGWVGLIWFVPFAGMVLYVLFGINRIQRKARRLRRRLKRSPATGNGQDGAIPNAHELEPLIRLVSGVTARPLLQGNRVLPLATGEAAYTQMLSEIASAKKSIGLSTYIFDNDKVGCAFADALSAAFSRGVSVRVLVDDIGSRYSFPSIFGRLRAAGVPVACFLPTLLPWKFAYAQLRNHRKILVVDGCIGFTGGMNLRDGHDSRSQPQYPITDCHFRLDGPVVIDMRAVFADDWQFTTGERLSGAAWFPELEHRGNGAARGIASGPDDNFETLRLTYLGAITCARRSVRIVTPYFLPDDDLISALNVAALKGVQVDILIPEKNNLLLVQWAMMGQLGQLLEYGCRVWLTPAPFDHSKLFLVDDEWCLIGSANWDARSLRLNFEFNIECYGGDLINELGSVVDRKLSVSRPLTLDELNRRSLAAKFRDGVARLAAGVSYL